MLLSGAFLHCILVHFWVALDIYNIFVNNDIDIALSGIRQEHLKLFKKLGGVEIYKELPSYGTLETPCLIISYNPNEASNFFKKVFLEE